MSSRHSQLNHRLYETVKRELGPEYIRLFAPHLFSHGVPAGVTGMILSGTVAMYIMLLFFDLNQFADYFAFIFIPVVVFMVFTYAFPFQNMVMGKTNHLRYFKIYGVLCTAVTLAAVFMSEHEATPSSLLEEYFLFTPVLIGVCFCIIIRTKKFAAMLAYQQKLWVIKHRLIEEDKALVAELTRSTRKK